MAARKKQAAKEPRAVASRGPRLVLENLRCFQRAEVPLDQQVTVIIGQNGSGKTTIAEALASPSFPMATARCSRSCSIWSCATRCSSAICCPPSTGARSC